MGKLDTNKQIKHKSLLDTAFSLFTTKGFSKTSISDISTTAGVGKGTFYLYFKDKHDIRNKLISHKSSQIFKNATVAFNEKFSNDSEISFEDRLIFIVDNIINQLNENKSLLNFIAKNLSWGIFKNALTAKENDDDIDFKKVYFEMINNSSYNFDQPELMLFMIVELVSSTCYSAILYSDPVCLDELKPRLYETIRNIINSHKTKKK